MPDTTLPPIEETQPGAGSMNPEEQGAEAIVREPLTWWEQKLQTLSPEDRESIVGKLKGYDKEVSRRLNQIKQRESEIASVADKLERAAQNRPQAVSQAKTESIGVIDQLISEAGDAAQRETLVKLREAIRQESRRDDLEKKIEKLESIIHQQSQTTSLTHSQVLEKELKGLEGEYGPELVDKYADVIKAYGSKPENHTFSAEKLLLSVANPDEVKQALKVQGRRQQAEPQKPKSPTPLSTSSPQHPSERFKGKSAREIQAGVGNAISEAVAVGLKKRLGSA